MIRRCFQRQVWHRVMLPIKGRLRLLKISKPLTTKIHAHNLVWETIYISVFGAPLGPDASTGISDKRTINRSMEEINA